jgi:phosphoribosylformylglycinamidine synthase
MADACRALDFPIVSGNVSLYNESKAPSGSGAGGSAILPTPAIGGIGLLADIDRMATIAFKQTGDIILCVGKRGGHLGQSLWLREVHGVEGADAGPPPRVDLDAEKRTGELIRAGIRAGAVTACHDVSDGGLAVTVAEMALAGNIGALLDKPLPHGVAASWFAEDQGVYVVTVRDAALMPFLTNAQAAGVEAEPIGRTIAGRIIFELTASDHAVSLADLRAAHEGFFPALMDG